MPNPTCLCREVMDLIGLNYQGEGIRTPLNMRSAGYPNTSCLRLSFTIAFPGKLILSCENASALSSRGNSLSLLPVQSVPPVREGFGGDPETQQVSSYELYTAPFAPRRNKVFASLDRHPYVAGGFVWSGWDLPRNQRLTMGHAVPTVELLIWRVLKRTVSTSINLTGVPKHPWRIFYLTELAGTTRRNNPCPCFYNR